MTQQDLFDSPIDLIPPPASGRTDTSRQAAEKIALNVGTLRHSTYRAILHSSYGLTASEIADLLGRRLLGVRPRTTELQKAGLIHDSHIRRPNSYGNNEIVWVA